MFSSSLSTLHTNKSEVKGCLDTLELPHRYQDGKLYNVLLVLDLKRNEQIPESNTILPAILIVCTAKVVPNMAVQETHKRSRPLQYVYIYEKVLQLRTYQLVGAPTCFIQYCMLLKLCSTLSFESLRDRKQGHFHPEESRKLRPPVSLY